MNSSTTTLETPGAATLAAARTTKSFTRLIPTIVRILMGLLFFVGGLNGLFNFLPPPSAPLPEGAAAFAGALMKTGYMFPLIMGTQAIVGALLLANRLVPLALVLIAPFIVNSVAFHLFLEPTGRGMAAVVLGLEVALAWAYRKAYRPLLVARAVPA